MGASLAQNAMQTRVAILELRQANNRTPAACNNKYILGATPIVNLQISQQYLQQICQQVERHYPQESCGLLLGRVVAQVNCIVEIYPTENSWDEADLTAFAAVSGSASLGGSRRERYAIAPQTLLQVQRQARDRDLQIVGVYHSHPDHPAIPSEFDRAIAWSQYSYLILSVLQGQVRDHRSWRLDEQHQFQEEKILYTNAAEIDKSL